MPQRILAIDIGGSGLKAAVVDADGTLMTDRLRVATPKDRGPHVITTHLLELIESLKPFDCLSVGFPGVLVDGTVHTAPNLGTKQWHGFNLAGFFQNALGKDVHVLNDADVQGLCAISGTGFELVCTLGTGFGTTWFKDGVLLPHLELAHMPANGKGDFDRYVGDHGLQKIRKKKWNRRVAWVVDLFTHVMNFDHLYLGGGNAEKIEFDLARNVTVIPNKDGLRGAAFVWRSKRPPSRSAR